MAAKAVRQGDKMGGGSDEKALSHLAEEPHHILVVDDLCMLTKKLFKQYFRKDLSLKFHFAKNGKSALAKIDEIPFDIIVTDINMLEMNGIQLLRSIRDSGKKLVAIIMTAYDITEYQEDVKELRIFKVFSKPVDFPLLAVAIQQGLIKSELLNDED